MNIWIKTCPIFLIGMLLEFIVVSIKKYLNNINIIIINSTNNLSVDFPMENIVKK